MLGMVITWSQRAEPTPGWGCGHYTEGSAPFIASQSDDFHNKIHFSKSGACRKIIFSLTRLIIINISCISKKISQILQKYFDGLVSWFFKCIDVEVNDKLS